MSSQGNSEKQRPANLKKEIQNLRKSNERLRSQIEEEKRKINIGKENANQIELRARELQAEKEHAQKQISNAPEELKKCLDQYDQKFKIEQLVYKQKLREIKKETVRINRLTEAASQNLHNLQKQITKEYQQLQKIDLQEKNELDGAEAELKKLESEEIRLLKLIFCSNSIPNQNSQTQDLHNTIPVTQFVSFNDNETKTECFDGQLNRLRFLKEKLEKKIYQCEPRDSKNQT